MVRKCCSSVFFMAGSTGMLMSSMACRMWDRKEERLGLRRKEYSSYS